MKWTIQDICKLHAPNGLMLMLLIPVICLAFIISAAIILPASSYASDSQKPGRDELQSAIRGQGLFVFSGTVRVHQEVFPTNQRMVVDVASVVLDTPLKYTETYKDWGYQTSASEISVASTSPDDGDYGYWSSMNGRRITVCCSSIRTALHDGSYYKVDAFASSDVRLMYSDEATGPEMCRLYNPNSGEHFYTADFSEAASTINFGWQHEGIGWTAPETSNTPVYRMYNPNAGEHHYCIDPDEKDGLVSAGWSYEGIGWYSDDNQTVPLYRDYNPNQFANNHNYTVDREEHEWLLSLGWRDEGYAWYGM